MLDLVISGGLVVDGTGVPGRLADVGIAEGRVAAVGRLAGTAARRLIDASGLVVAPGIVDVHTHYDPQLTWDPVCDTSPLHGVTTVLAGNCGFSIAPCRPQDRDYLAQVFARVEGMDLAALGHVDWRFETFPELLGALEGCIGPNVGMYVGHSALRRYVMGEESHTRAARPEELEEIAALLAGALEAGAMGWSSSQAPVHLDLADRPVPSRAAGTEELLRMADVQGRVGRGTIAHAPASGVEGIDEADRELLIELSRRGGVPVITQGLGGRNKVEAPELAWEEAAAFLDRSAAAGTPVYCLLMTRGFSGPLCLAERTSRYEGVPLWDELFRSSVPDRIDRLRDEAFRRRLREAIDHPNRDPSRGSTLPPPHWEVLTVEATTSDRNRRHLGRSVAEVAREARVHPADALFDLALAEDLRTVFRWSNETPAWYEVLRQAQRHPAMLLGVSDGGAHLDRDDGAGWSSHFLARWWRDERLWRLEEAVRLISAVPAAVCGVANRGMLLPGWWADVVVFDPETVGTAASRLESDRVTGASRFRNVPTGIRATIVNGRPLVEDGEPTGELPGQVVRPA